jgi:hypothetical protein
MSQSVSRTLQFKVTLREKQRKDDPTQRIFIHPNKRGDPDQLDDLPLSEFPITHKIRPKGILVVCVDGRSNAVKQNNSVTGAFHRFDGTDQFRYRRFFVGSAGKTSRIYTAQWRAFVKRFGLAIGQEKNLRLQISQGGQGQPYIFTFY